MFILNLESCKKKSVNPDNSNPTKVYCIFTIDNGVETFYTCTSDRDEMSKIMIKLRDSGLFGVAWEKENCSKCK